MIIARNVLRILTSIAALCYLFIFIDEAFPPYDAILKESTLGVAMVFVLFVWFCIGYYYL